MRLVVARNVVLSIVQGVLSFRFLEKERRGKKRKEGKRNGFKSKKKRLVTGN